MGLKVIIAEDNEVFRTSLLNRLSSVEEFQAIYIASNGNELLQLAREVRPDVIITDIDMPGISGIEAAQIIRRQLSDVEIIFISSYDDYIKEAVQLYAMDYIEKPLNEIRLMSTINRLIRKVGFSSRRFQFTTEKGIEYAYTDDLYMVEALRKKTMVYTTYKVFESHHSLKELEMILSSPVFFKSSRSFIINLKKVSSLVPITRTSFQVSFRDKDFKAQLSKTLLQDLRKQLKTYEGI